MRRGVGWSLLCATLLAAPALGEPLAAGDSGLRHAIQLLGDAGVLGAPVTGWPVSSGDLDGLRDAQGLAPELESARQRVLVALGLPLSATLAAGGRHREHGLRGFDATPRDDGHLRVGLDWRGRNHAVRLRLSRAADPADDRPWRADGSSAGLRVGNWWLGADVTDRWWGPGWDGSLILSGNARPVPALTLQRDQARPFTSRWLRWIGPWTTQVVWGQLEGERDRDNARLFGWRVGARPLPRLEVGLSRAAQWCGEGRPCDFSAFTDLLSGVRDNRGENTNFDDEPGNQLAGFDLRLRVDALGRPFALYGQRIGEDERDGLPSANLVQVGVSTWGAAVGGGSYRAHLEYADTACGGFTGGDPIFGCAYNHSIYTDGYRYRGRVIGHSQESDARVYSAGLLLITDGAGLWRAGLRQGELNRDSRSRNTLAVVATDIIDLELAHTRETPLGKLSLGLGAERLDADGFDATWYGRVWLSIEASFELR